MLVHNIFATNAKDLNTLIKKAKDNERYSHVQIKNYNAIYDK